MVVLRKGNILYSGEVEKMINSHGYFELNSENNDELEQILKDLNLFKTIQPNEMGITAHLNQDFSASELNKILVSKGIFVSHLVKKKKVLKSNF